MKSAFIFVPSFLLVAAVHGAVLLETRYKVLGSDSGHQNGNGTFVVDSNCTTGSGGLLPTNPMNQSSDGSHSLPKCYNLTDTDPSGNQTSFLLQYNDTSPGHDGDSCSDHIFNYCPSPDGPEPPFANGTSVSFKEVPCQDGTPGNTTFPGGPADNSTLPTNTTLPSGTPDNSTLPLNTTLPSGTPDNSTLPLNATLPSGTPDNTTTTPGDDSNNSTNSGN